jgi:rubredoxin
VTTITEHCKHCSYKFSETDLSSICPVCCGTRDKYENLAHEWGCTRQEAKDKYYHLTYGTGAEVARKIYNKHGSRPIFEGNNES